MTKYEAENTLLELPTVLDLVAAPVLLESLLRRRGAALLLDGSNVQRFGAQCLQILLSARAAWVADEHSFIIENCSDDFSTSLELMGIPPANLSYRKEPA